MSKAEDLLNSLSDEEIMMYSTAVGEEGHIIIGADRTVTVPDELKKIAVQYDHNVETVTFDCPRYSDGVDMSEMVIYVNYMRPDGYKDAYPCNNIVVDETDPEIMHFDWTITRNATQVPGNLRFLVCVKKTDIEGNDVNHWNSDLCSDVRVGEGLECEEQIEQENPDTITSILTRLDTIDSITTSKVNVSDIIDNLTTNVSNKPLSAAQGVALKALIDGVTSMELDESLSDNTKAAPAGMVGELKSDLANSKKVIEELNDKKITKFYASNLGKTNLSDSDKGKIQDMMLYGKSSQDRAPTPENPVEIKSVVNPTVKIAGKNLLNAKLQTTTINGITCTANGDGTYTLNGTATTRTELWLIGGYNNNIKIPLNPTKKYVLKGTGNINIQMHAGTADNTLISANGRDINLSNMAGIAFILIRVNDGTTVNNFTIYPQLEEGFTSTTYEPYKPVQIVTLPYTLNAIPVSSGGNVTIDGQEYIADYVDVEKKQLVRMAEPFVFDGSEEWSLSGINEYGINNFNINTNRKYKSNIILCSMFKLQSSLFLNTKDEGIMVNESYNLYLRIKADRISTVDDLKTLLSNNNMITLFALYTPTTIDLTDEEVQLFKELATYYPTTNVFVTSDQLDGYTEFNYPVSLAEGWNYVKQQLGDTREYIYDMDLQSAEAYVNSEYSVALAELEV